MSDKQKYAVTRFDNNVDFVPEFVEGEFDIPFIKPEPYVDNINWIPFNYASTRQYKREEFGIHFFVYDYYFNCIWNQRDKYANMLRGFKAVMTPDFSPYIDWPIMVQRWNHYRKHLIGAWMQDIGCRVYPTITWNDERSYEWCFDGEPYKSTVCVSSVGMMKSKELTRLFIKGYDKMMEVLEPETIIFYGQIPVECTGNIIPLTPFQERFKGVKKHD